MGLGNPPATSARQVQPSSGVAKKLYSDVMGASINKRYKLMVKSKSNQMPDTFKNVLKTKINQNEMKAGMKTLKSLKGGRVLIKVGSIDETNLLSSNIRDKCGEELEINVPKLWNTRLNIHNFPQVENLEETILALNPELNSRI
jgi:hypothetical protein